MASADLLEDSRVFNLLLVNDGMCRHQSHINTHIGTYYVYFRARDDVCDFVSE